MQTFGEIWPVGPKNVEALYFSNPDHWVASRVSGVFPYNTEQ